MNPYWSYILTAVGVTGLVLAGQKKAIGWAIGVATQGLWIAYSIDTEQWGFLISSFVYGGVYSKNFLSWFREENPLFGQRVREAISPALAWLLSGRWGR